jgi:hypothetical protein
MLRFHCLFLRQAYRLKQAAMNHNDRTLTMVFCCDTVVTFVQKLVLSELSHSVSDTW